MSRSETLGPVFAFIIILCISGAAYAVTFIDFENGNLDDWEIIDDADLDPVNNASAWEIRESQLGLSGKSLHQMKNIWGDATNSCLMGTFIIYKGEKFSNFVMDIDVAADDDDGMGLVWAYEGTDKHYRVIMINDQQPSPNPVDEIMGPFMKISKRISNEAPWYELLAVVKDDYVPYSQQSKLHWILEVNDGMFTFRREDGLSITASDQEYRSGYVGIQLYAQAAEFDNLMIASTADVRPEDELATMWGAVKYK